MVDGQTSDSGKTCYIKNRFSNISFCSILFLGVNALNFISAAFQKAQMKLLYVEHELSIKEILNHESKVDYNRQNQIYIVIPDKIREANILFGN